MKVAEVGFAPVPAAPKAADEEAALVPGMGRTEDVCSS